MSIRSYKKKRFCKRGHDVFIVKRTKAGACPKCVKITRKIYERINKEKIAKRKRIANRKKRTEHSAYVKKWRLENKERFQQYQQQYNDSHTKKRKRYYKINRKRILKRQWKYVMRKLKTDIYFRLQYGLRTRLRQALKGNFKNGSAVRDLGCSILFFKKYISKKFYSRMSGKNYGKYWELDHIIPLWKFDLRKRRQLLKAVNYRNLQPLTISDHRKKTAKEAKELRIKIKGDK